MAWDKIWEEIFIERDWGKYPAENLIRFIAKNLYKNKQERVKILEIGCGTGANIWYLTREGFDAYGIDGSRTAIEKAKQYLAEEKLSAKLYVGDINNLPFESNYFDGVIDIECLYCNDFKSSQKILYEIHRVLKNKGKLFSRSFSDKMFTGVEYNINKYEFKNVKDGPLKGKGFVRLLPYNHIEELYGNVFDIQSIDIENYTMDNGTINISEYIIICKKNV